MKTYYQASGWMKMSEEDIYEDGCQPDTGGLTADTEIFQSETLDGLLKELLSFTGADTEAIQLNACEETGRVDISTMENDYGYPASDQQLAEWKDGKIRLWNCIYTFTVEKITSETVNLEEITA